MIERAAAHVGERRNLDRAAFKSFPVLSKPSRSTTHRQSGRRSGIDLLREVSGQETQPFAASTAGRTRRDA